MNCKLLCATILLYISLPTIKANVLIHKIHTTETSSNTPLLLVVFNNHDD